MPFINTKYTQEITAEQEEQIKSALGQAITEIGKTESWLMVGFEQNCHLYFRGERSERIAFCDVSLYGTADPAACDRLGFVFMGAPAKREIRKMLRRYSDKKVLSPFPRTCRLSPDRCIRQMCTCPPDSCIAAGTNKKPEVLPLVYAGGEGGD